jgi:hypothetical protein
MALFRGLLKALYWLNCFGFKYFKVKFGFIEKNYIGRALSNIPFWVNCA